MGMVLKNSEPQLKVSRDWSEVAKVASTGADRLTYVPGLVGDITEWIVSTSMLPNRMMAPGVSRAVVGTLISRKVLGPTSSMTHLYIVLIAPTGDGKYDPMQRGRDLIAAVVEEDAGLIIGDTKWQSAPGIEKMLDECPVRIAFIDEVGDELLKINSQSGNPFVAATSGLLKEIYDARRFIQTGRTKHEMGVTIYDPAYTLVCAATPAKFWGGFGSGDLESGVMNRYTVLPVVDTNQTKFRIIPYEAMTPPRWLVEELRKLPRCKISGLSILDQPIRTKDDQPIIKWSKVDDWIHYGWENQQVADIWLAAKEEWRAEKNEKKRLLGKRAAENAIRNATIIAAGCFRQVILNQDVAWALALAKQSVDVAYEGVQKFLHTFLFFPEMCQEVYDCIRGKSGFASERDLNRELGRKDRYGQGLLGKALVQLKAEGRIKGPVSRATGGRPALGYELVETGE